MSNRTDAELLVASDGDPTAFRELYDRHALRIHTYLRRRTGNDEAAYDLTAETFARAWLMRRRFRDECDGAAGPWLFALARNALLTSVRRAEIERRARDRLALTVPAEAGAAVTPAAEPDGRWLDGLDEALAELPAGQREALMLRVEEDLAYAQIADRLGTTPQNARVRVHRALTTLRRRFTSSIEVTP
jgi:RNA polymerase sigma factor (sigma-70 family)